VGVAAIWVYGEIEIPPPTNRRKSKSPQATVICQHGDSPAVNSGDRHRPKR
jgi:hypothetical protein